MLFKLAKSTLIFGADPKLYFVVSGWIFMPLEGRHIAFELSVCQSVRPSVRKLYHCQFLLQYWRNHPGQHFINRPVFVKKRLSLRTCIKSAFPRAQLICRRLLRKEFWLQSVVAQMCFFVSFVSTMKLVFSTSI